MLLSLKEKCNWTDSRDHCSSKLLNMFQCECSHSITYRHNLHRDQDHYIYLTICKLICSHTTALGSKGNEIFFLSLDQAKKTGALLENDDDAGHLGRIFSKWWNLSWLVRERSVTWIFQTHLFLHSLTRIIIIIMTVVAMMEMVVRQKGQATQLNLQLISKRLSWLKRKKLVSLYIHLAYFQKVWLFDDDHDDD